MTKADFKVVFYKRKWVVSRVGSSRDHHAHFNRKDTCYRVIKSILKGILPKEKHFQDSIKRLTTADEYAGFKIAKRQRYYNHSKARYPNNRRFR